MFNRKIENANLKLFPPGKQIAIEGSIYTVENVCVQGSKLLVKFKELGHPVDSEKINCEYSEVDFNQKTKYN